MPHTVVFAFPIGIWFGYVAWKTGSIWPTILGHALINGLWNVLNISKYQLGYSDSLYWSAAAALAVLGVVSFAWVLPTLRRLAAPEPLQG
jgi:membrane protease YdiL (CAAX protease family)